MTCSSSKILLRLDDYFHSRGDGKMTVAVQFHTPWLWEPCTPGRFLFDAPELLCGLRRRWFHATLMLLCHDIVIVPPELLRSHLGNACTLLLLDPRPLAR